MTVHMCGWCGGIADVSMTMAGYMGWLSLARRHRMECLKIPRVYKSGSGTWWVIEYANGGRMWTGSWENAIRSAVRGCPSWP